jgi:hypothetical protein
MKISIRNFIMCFIILIFVFAGSGSGSGSQKPTDDQIIGAVRAYLKQFYPTDIIKNIVVTNGYAKDNNSYIADVEYDVFTPKYGRTEHGSSKVLLINTDKKGWVVESHL